jgi:hypothetical protein
MTVRWLLLALVALFGAWCAWQNVGLQLAWAGLLALCA